MDRREYEKTQFGNIVSHTKIHICAKYGHIITNYAMEMVISWSFDLKRIYVYRKYIDLFVK